MSCSCDGSGEVLILPREGGPGQFSNERYEVLYSAGTLLNHYSEVHGETRIPEGARERLQRFPVQPFVVRVREGEEARTALRLAADRRVERAIPNVGLQLAGHVELVEDAIDGAADLHGASIGAPLCGSGVRVAILDTGVDPRHVRRCRAQYDVTSPATSVAPHDDEGHGTVVAAIIQSIAPSAEILSVKLFPQATLAGMVIGIQLAMAIFEPHIVNLSLGLDVSPSNCRSCGYRFDQQFPEPLVDSFFATLAYGAPSILPLFVAAAGNKSKLLLPARSPFTLSVGAYDQDLGDRPSYARYPKVPNGFLMADGGDMNRPYAKTGWAKAVYGTSFSAAVVSGVAARFACAYVDSGNPCGGLRLTGLLGLRDYGSSLRHDLKAHAQKVPGHRPEVHGWGLARYH